MQLQPSLISRAKSHESRPRKAAQAASTSGRKEIKGLPATDAMVEYRERKLLSYSQDQLFDMVVDIDNYKTFLPYCRQSKVVTTSETGCSAELEISFGLVTECYTSNVSWKRRQVVTAVATDTKLFEELTNKWTFIPGPSRNGRPSTYVDIYVGFEFKNPVYALMARAVFDKVTQEMIRAFEERAGSIYGLPPS